MTNANVNPKQPPSNPPASIPPLPTTNSDLKSLQDSLLGTVSSINDAIGSAPDAQTVEALATEMSEINHRVTIVGGLLFTENSQDIAKAVQGVSSATTSVNQSIQEAQSAIQVINSVTSYLTLVDKVIDTAKEIAAA